MSRRRQPVVKRATENRVIVGQEDMVLLQNINDSGILANLRSRISSAEIYTFIGPVLVACNPYKWLTIYDNETMKKYIHQQRVDVPPHIFATAEAAYRTMVTEDDNQCLIISGESGAGKTEASKQIQSYIATVCGGGEEVDALKRIFLESNPVLEAFGNAKTLRNNNSSRFGKYFVLKFNRFGIPLGGSVTNYLLEKSRIVKPGRGERNFHIFYQLLNSDYCKPLALNKGAYDDYRFLSISKCSTVDGVDDSAEFNHTISAMKHVDIKSKQIQSILSIVAGVLHLGNVSFQPKDVNGSEGSKIVGKDSIVAFCDLLKIPIDTISHAILFRELQTMAPGGKIDSYEVAQNPAQAAGRRDAIAKVLYERLFDLIVERINVALDGCTNSGANAHLDEDEIRSIGVLDIYGFEVFEKNGFEQLCINYVNEKLQQIFIELTLRAEQDEYEAEGIVWKPIPFFNNKIVCDLLDGSRPPGIFRALDDTCKTLHAMQDQTTVDRKFIESAAQLHSQHAHFSIDRDGFKVKHYAGDVTYHCGNFGDSNKDALGKDLILAIQTSTDKLVLKLFSEVVDMNDKKQPPTAGNKIRTQCQALVTDLMDCTPHYVRCIKSNDDKKALTMDDARVKHQIQYLGLAENIKVRRAGYAYRSEYDRFHTRFAILSPATYPEWRGSDKDACRKILSAASKRIPTLNKEEAQLGTSKIFIRQPETYFALERLREFKLGDFAATIQKAWRNYFGLKDYIRMQRTMANLYKENRKMRRRDSIARPFSGDYLGTLGDKADEVRDAIYRVVDHYDDTENILFADALCGQLVKCTHEAEGVIVEDKIVVLTNAALYLFDLTSADIACNLKSRKSARNEEVAMKMHFLLNDRSGVLQEKRDAGLLPLVLLRRRLSFKKGPTGDSQGTINGLKLSQQADAAIAITVQPQSGPLSEQTDHFVKDDSADKCTASGTVFTMFNRRHHCRVTGNIFVDTCSNYKQHIPDMGYYTPQRCNDNSIGLYSTDLIEDVLLMVPRRTELMALVDRQFQINKKAASIPLSFSNNLTLSAGKISTPTGFFASTTDLIESRVPTLVAFKEVRGGKNVVFQYKSPYNMNVSNIGSGSVEIASESGLSHNVVEEINQRAAERQRKKEKKRKALEAERRERAAQREEEREMERKRRLAIKKKKKKAEKEERKARMDVEEAKKVKPKVGRSFGSSSAKESSNGDNEQKSGTSGGGLSELQKKLAKRASMNS